jgi:drug/metabolite transporter (DMT)-like permease
METISIIFNTWQFNLVAALVFAVLFIQFYKLAVKDTSSDGISAVVIQFIAGSSILIFVPLFPFKFTYDIRIVILFAVAAIFYALNDRMQVTIRKNLEVSVYTILNQLVKVFLIVYGIAIFHEEIVANKLIGGGLILMGNAVLFYNKKTFKLNKYVILSIFASFFVATALIIDVDISRHFNLPFYIMLTLIIPGILIYITERHSLKNIIEEFNSKRKNFYLVTGVSWGIMVLFTIRALQSTDVVFMAPLLALSVLLNVIIASIFHKERNDLRKKIIAAVVVIAGVFLMVN